MLRQSVNLGLTMLWCCLPGEGFKFPTRMLSNWMLYQNGTYHFHTKLGLICNWRVCRIRISGCRFSLPKSYFSGERTHSRKYDCISRLAKVRLYGKQMAVILNSSVIMHWCSVVIAIYRLLILVFPQLINSFNLITCLLENKLTV